MLADDRCPVRGLGARLGVNVKWRCLVALGLLTLVVGCSPRTANRIDRLDNSPGETAAEMEDLIEVTGAGLVPETLLPFDRAVCQHPAPFRSGSRFRCLAFATNSVRYNFVGTYVGEGRATISLDDPVTGWIDWRVPP